MEQNFTISDAAAERIKVLSQEEDHPDTVKLRITISGGGCSGFQYHFELDNLVASDDHVFEHNGARVVVDETSLSLLNGAMIDYVEDLAAAMFVIKNPNAASSCGCGNSFSV
jgi:iron-sulfur cluster insertion protein